MAEEYTDEERARTREDSRRLLDITHRCGEAEALAHRLQAMVDVAGYKAREAFDATDDPFFADAYSNVRTHLHYAEAALAMVRDALGAIADE